MIDINKLIDEYYQWLKSRTDLFTNPDTGWTQISTPFSGLFNDPVEIYAKSINDKILLSDDGLTFRNLDLLGAPATRSHKRKEILNKILLNYGVRIENNELVVEATEKDFPQKKHNLISTIGEISDMFMLAKHTVASVFKEDVQNYLEEQSIIYTPQFIARGSTGLEFTFDFHIAHRKREIVLKTFNILNTFNLPHFLFTWDDIKEAREKITGKNITGLAIVNDTQRTIKTELLDAIKAKNADFILWSEKDKPENKEKLAA